MTTPCFFLKTWSFTLTKKALSEAPKIYKFQQSTFKKLILFLFKHILINLNIPITICLCTNQKICVVLRCWNNYSLLSSLPSFSDERVILIKNIWNTDNKILNLNDSRFLEVLLFGNSSFNNTKKPIYFKYQNRIYCLI